MTQATLHDDSIIDLHVRGGGPTVLLPVKHEPTEPERAAELRRFGADPDLGPELIAGLADRFTVVAFDYEAQVLANPKPETLTPDNIAADLLAVADAAGAERFAYYGYSWLALSGLQLAVRTNRLTGLIMGGFPPIGGPYPQMLRVTRATHEMATSPQSGQAAAGLARSGAAGDTDASEEFDWSSVEMTMSPEQTRQFLTLYQALQGFDDEAAQSGLRCPRLCFAGGSDTIEYGERWGDVVVDIAGPLLTRRRELTELGWQVRVLQGKDHTTAMHASAVLPIIGPWLAKAVGNENP